MQRIVAYSSTVDEEQGKEGCGNCVVIKTRNPGVLTEFYGSEGH